MLLDLMEGKKKNRAREKTYRLVQEHKFENSHLYVLKHARTLNNMQIQ